MIMSLSLLIRRVFRRQLTVAGKKAKILSLQINTSPIYITDIEPGWRPADENELKLFVENYKPAGWLSIHGIGRNSTPTMFGPMLAVYQTRKRGVKKIDQNPIWGLERGSMILFVEKSEAA